MKGSEIVSVSAVFFNLHTPPRAESTEFIIIAMAVKFLWPRVVNTPDNISSVSSHSLEFIILKLSNFCFLI